jgi:uncharacterized protein (TIGR04255 family)
MGKKMKNSPVYFTVAQVRFNPILNMEAFLPAIQEKMRKANFPAFKRENIQQLIFQFSTSGDGNEPPKPSFGPQPRFIFGNIEATTELVLENNALALHTTTYDTSEAFFIILLGALRILHEVVGLDFTERIGLRYFDAILPKSNESLSDYLTSEVLGLSQKLDGKLSHSYCETVTVNTSGQLVSRVVIQDGRVTLPPDVMVLAPRIAPRFTAQVGLHAVIDTDASHEQREVFSLETIGSKLVALHDEIWKSFKATVTQLAVEAWD